MLIGGKKQKTNVRFSSVKDFETYINATNVDCDSQDVVFTGWLYEFNRPELIKVNRSLNDRGTEFKPDFVEHTGTSFYIPTSGNCFTKCNNHLPGRNY